MLSIKPASSYIYPKGSVRDALLQTTSVRPIFTEEEKSQIQESKQILSSHINMLEAMKKKYGECLRDPDKNTQAVQILNSITALRKRSLEYIQFLSGKAERLLHHDQSAQSASEFEIVLDFARNLIGAEHPETLGIQMDLGIAQISIRTSASGEIGRALIEKTLEKLLFKLSESPSNPQLKRMISIGDFLLAQYYVEDNNFDKANIHLERSEQLRKEYGATEIDFDKINFLRGVIASKKNNISEALQKLITCYQFRKAIDPLSSNLIPVLQQLCQIIQDTDTLIDYYVHLLEIQKHNQINKRQIIRTQLIALGVMQSKISRNEFWETMKSVVNELDGLPIMGEDVEVGLSYFNLADIRMSFFLPDWSSEEKRNYYSDTLKIIVKAQLHLQSASCPLPVLARFNTELTTLKENCILLINFHDEHPEFFQSFATVIHAKKDNESELSLEQELAALSEFSSEVRHSQVDPNERLLTVTDFQNLPDEGLINPCRLRTAQGGINTEFRDGKSLVETLQQLISDPSYTRHIPPIEIGIHNGKVFSFDTRRLITHQKAKESNPAIYIRYKKIEGEYLHARIEAIFSPRPWNGLVTAERYAGKNSESRPYVNPTYRSQLENVVQNSFKSYPHDRQGADPNGFPIKAMQAKNIFSFFKEQKEKGSASATVILEQVHDIFNTEGKEAAFEFLIKTKHK